MPQIIPVQDHRGNATPEQQGLQSHRQRGFSGTGEAGQPDDRTLVTEVGGTRLPGNPALRPGQVLPGDGFGKTGGIFRFQHNSPPTQSRSLLQGESPQRFHTIMSIVHEGPAAADPHFGHFKTAHLLAGPASLLQLFGVDHPFDRHQARLDVLRGQAQLHRGL